MQEASCPIDVSCVRLCIVVSSTYCVVFFVLVVIPALSPPVVCRRLLVLFTLFVFVCVQWCPAHIVLCFLFQLSFLHLHLQLFVGGFLSYLRQLCSFVHSGVQHILCCVFCFSCHSCTFTSSCLQEASCLIDVICVRLCIVVSSTYCVVFFVLVVIPAPSPPVVGRRLLVLFTLFVFVCAQWCPAHIVLCFLFQLSFLHLHLQLLVGGFLSYLRYLCSFVYSGVQHILCCVFCFSCHSCTFTSSCLQEASCIIYVICVRLCIVVSSTYCVVFFALVVIPAPSPPVVCRRLLVLSTLFVLFVHSGVQHILYCVFCFSCHSCTFTSSCLQEASCLIYVICVRLCIVVFSTYCVVFFVLVVIPAHSPPVVCRRLLFLFTLFVLVCAQWCPAHIVLCFLFQLSFLHLHLQLFVSSCLQEASCLIYVICVRLCIVVSSIYCVVFFVLVVIPAHSPPVVCRRLLVLLTLFVFVCVQWCPAHIVLCFLFQLSFLHLHLQLFVGGFLSYLRYLCSFVHSGVQHILCCVFCFSCHSCTFTSSCLQEASCLIHVICVRLCIVVSSTYCVVFFVLVVIPAPSPPVVCRRLLVLFTLFVFVCAQWCPAHIVLCFLFQLSFLHLHLQLFVGGFLSYLRYLCSFVHSGVQHILCCVFCFSCHSCTFTSSCLQEASCLIHVICVRLCIVVSSTYCVVFFVLVVIPAPSPPVVCRRLLVLFTLFVFVCAQWCPAHIVLCFLFQLSFLHLHLQLFVGGFLSYLRYLCSFVHSGVQHILCCVFCFSCHSCTFTSSCLQEASCIIYVICVRLCIVVSSTYCVVFFVLVVIPAPSPPVVCRRLLVLFTLFVFVCVQWCPTHIVLCFLFQLSFLHLHLQLFVGGFLSYLRYLCSFVHSGVQHILCCVFVLVVIPAPSPPVVCRRLLVLLTLFVFVCAQWCPAHIVLCFLVQLSFLHRHLQLFVGGFLSY